MNFKEALIAHLQGENVQVREYIVWKDFKNWLSDIKLFADEMLEREFAADTQFRIKPRTIRVNGVEVLTPERSALPLGVTYYVPDPGAEDFYSKWTWGRPITRQLFAFTRPCLPPQRRRHHESKSNAADSRIV